MFNIFKEKHLSREEKGNVFPESERLEKNVENKEITPNNNSIIIYFLWSVFTHVVNEHVFQLKQKKTFAQE